MVSFVRSFVRSFPRSFVTLSFRFLVLPAFLYNFFLSFSCSLVHLSFFPLSLYSVFVISLHLSVANSSLLSFTPRLPSVLSCSVRSSFRDPLVSCLFFFVSSSLVPSLIRVFFLSPLGRLRSVRHLVPCLFRLFSSSSLGPFSLRLFVSLSFRLFVALAF